MTYDPGLHHRQSLRLRGYDYSQAGAYFVTVCVQDRACLFGEVIGDQMHLNDAGRMVLAEWNRLTIRFPAVELDTFGVMPNHIHGILVISIPVPATHAPFDANIDPNASASPNADACVNANANANINVNVGAGLVPAPRPRETTPADRPAANTINGPTTNRAIANQTQRPSTGRPQTGQPQGLPLRRLRMRQIRRMRLQGRWWKMPRCRLWCRRWAISWGRSNL